ncbi:MAG: hemerythrin domain-containing protein [Gammaproteobacteria bacterium]|nr:hemerythrin domain-containing protein [Gammaproteobacteria bacterium]MDH4254253.1 hemerythrin domain-containing protein [Gammaproteobacteria bacterium]MDH5311023.1 hemerythrin domain-containing protein [Gammaproteobacteria bacterium]
MMFRNRICQRLHDEHAATVTSMERLESLIARHRGAPPTGADADSMLLRGIADNVELEVSPHFDFEEQHLFTYLEDMGDAAIGAHLASEHESMRPLGRRLAELARSAAQSGFDDASWSEFRRIGAELSERMLTHVQKEEMALLPLLDEAMDPATETRLFEAYTENS